MTTPALIPLSLGPSGSRRLNSPVLVPQPPQRTTQTGSPLTGTMTTPVQIPFSFGPGGSRSLNNLLFGPQHLDLIRLVTGVPTTPAQFIQARNLEVLTTLATKNYDLPVSQQFNIQAIGARYSIAPSQITQALNQAAIRYPKVLEGRSTDKFVATVQSVAEGIIAAVFAFLGGQAVAPLFAAEAVPTEAVATEATVTTSDFATQGSYTLSERLGSSFASNLGNTLDLGQVAGPSTLESALFGTPLEGSLTSLTQAAELGVTTPELFAPIESSAFSQFGTVVRTVGTSYGEGQLVTRLLTALAQGNFSLFGNILLGVIGIPSLIPGSGPQASLGVNTGGGGGVGVGRGFDGGGGFGGGGGVNPSYELTTSPHEVNVPAYVIGAFLIGLMLWMVVRKG